MKCEWKDLPKPLNAFTVRNATMINLNNWKPVQYYSANTRITLVQKAVTPKGTFYRTSSAEQNFLNYAFKASAFGLPDEYAPPVLPTKSKKDGHAAPLSNKTKNSPNLAKAKGGEPKKNKFKRLVKKVFGR